MAEYIFETFLDNDVSYQFASETLDIKGEKYKEYGIHDGKYDIDAIFYDGSILNGRKTKVFAYFGIPKYATENNPVPAVVCVHGGRGKAEISWVKKWNDMGYAAIAMDLYGNGPEDGINSPDDYTGKLKHPYAGMFPWDDYGTAFLEDYKNAGMYHNVINVINAHNLIRKNKRINKKKTGITGISWGGITTTIVCGVDYRFKFSAPIYGCGFLYCSQSYFKDIFKKPGATEKWDPSNFVKNAKMPVLYINGDCDAHFSVNASSLTYKATSEAYLSIRHNFVHGQPEGEGIAQVYSFAKAVFEENLSYIKIRKVYIKDNAFIIEYSKNDDIEIVNAETYYLKSEEIPLGGENILWHKKEEYALEKDIIKVNIPKSATYCYCSLKDSNDNIISTKVICNTII